MFYVLCYGPNHYAGGTQCGVQYLQSHANIPMDFLHSHKGTIHKGTIQECSLTNLDTCINFVKCTYECEDNVSTQPLIVT